ncbi:hypothetical protein AOQ84DRAFT_227030 [Glonium stellatum]|uniref:Uncharacterized protein n=1 Tax=Glonium stellatum TaxID=574774 RepID=A0A8E2ERQ9_9PEZI|nr:hypothetical protein AOQ84DRAFT_227030 [Glonium stellatum]
MPAGTRQKPQPQHTPGRKPSAQTSCTPSVGYVHGAHRRLDLNSKPHPFQFPDSYPSFASTREPCHRSNRRILALFLKAEPPKENASCKSLRSAYRICCVLHPVRTKQRLQPRASNMSCQCDDSLAMGAFNPIKPRAHAQAARESQSPKSLYTS